MRKLLVLLIVVSALWSGYWFAGSSALRNAATQWFADQAARGITAENTGLTVAGFPNRFDMTVNGIRFADPKTGIGWDAPFAQVFAMTWKPWHIIAALPPTQTIHLPDQDIALTSVGLRASVRARPDLSVPLAMAIVESGAWQATSTQGWVLGAATLVGSVGADAGTPAAYDIALDIKDLAPDPALLVRLPEGATLPPLVQVIRARLNARLTAPLDREAAQTRPRLIGLDVSDVLIGWGDLSITAEGLIEPDDTGFAAGRIAIEVTNWQQLIPLLVATGAVKPEVAPTIRNMLGAMAAEGGDPMVLKLPLTLASGRMSLGPLPLGDAPLLVTPSN
jgi:hypothetical protein